MKTLRDSWKEVDQLGDLLNGIVFRIAEIAILMTSLSGKLSRENPRVRKIRLSDVALRRQFFYTSRKYLALKEIFEKEISNV